MTYTEQRHIYVALRVEDQPSVLQWASETNSRVNNISCKRR